MWLFIAVLAYFLLAANSLIDRYILVKPVSNPIIYSFYVGVLSIFALVFVPFGFVWPGFSLAGFSLLVGVFFLFTLFIFFKTLRENEASRAIPIIGGFSPVFVFILSFLFLGERLGWLQIAAFLLLVAGGVLISVKKRDESAELKRFKKYSLKGLGIAVFSSLLFGIFYVSIKFIFIYQSFISGFIWTRMGSFFAVFLILVSSKNRKLIFGAARNLEKKTGALIIMNKALAGAAFMLINYAIFLGSVTLVSALQGIQYIFLLILAVFISIISPEILEERISKGVVAQKILAVFVIGAGLVVLSIAS